MSAPEQADIVLLLRQIFHFTGKRLFPKQYQIQNLKKILNSATDCRIIFPIKFSYRFQFVIPVHSVEPGHIKPVNCLLVNAFCDLHQKRLM